MTACAGSSSGGASPGATTPLTSTSPSAEVSTSSAAQPSLQERLDAVGVICQSPPSATGTKCRYHGEQVMVSTDSFDQTAALRHKACDDGYVNKSYLVATGDDLTLAPDYNSTARKLAALLGLRPLRYCS